MKTLNLLMVLLMAGLSPVWAQSDNADDAPSSEEEARERQKQQIAVIKEKMRYFEPFVAEWVGEEHYDYLLTGESTMHRDEWRGFFSLEGTHFEMHGKGEADEGEEPVTYKWICTYDPQAEVYRAWYFDSRGNTDEYEMDWDDKKKALVWTSESERMVRRFHMKVEGNELTGGGAYFFQGVDEPIARHTMSYKKRKIKI